MSISLTKPARTASASVGAIDPLMWPDIAKVPSGKTRARIARWIFQKSLNRMNVVVELPDGTRLGAGDLDAPLMRLIRPAAFYRRVGDSGLVGFGEAYMAGDWDTDDLSGVLTAMASHIADIVPPRLQRLRDLAVQHQPRRERNTRENARNNISRHYDLSNDLFALFLDETMSYSSALFTRDGLGLPLADADVLAEAQRRKVDRLLDQVGVTAGSHLLEIGTGWGELALRAAGRGARVTSITLSVEQQELARRRVEAAGLSHLVSIELRDYREQQGQFDAVISVEMIEAVGYAFWPVYFSTLDRLVRPGGKVGIQAITMPHQRMLASRDTYTWIHKYIFPGGIIPSTESIEHNTAADTSMRVEDSFAMGPDYAETLRVWRDTFTAHAGQVEEMGFDEVFRRMWTLYLGYSEAGFRSGYLNVYQYILAKDPSVDTAGDASAASAGHRPATGRTS